MQGRGEYREMVRMEEAGEVERNGEISEDAPSYREGSTRGRRGGGKDKRGGGASASIIEFANLSGAPERRPDR